MSVVLKKNQFKIEIRKQDIQNILQQKRFHYQIQKQVNQQFQSFLNNPIHQSITKLCVQHLQLIFPQKLKAFTENYKERTLRLDFSQPLNIAFINKLVLVKQSQNVQNYFEQITQFSKRITINVCGNQELLSPQNHWAQISKKQRNLRPSEQLKQTLFFAHNCLLQYWGLFLLKGTGYIHVESYCQIYKVITHWFNETRIYPHLNKKSVCFFIKNYINNEGINFQQNDLPYIKNIEELHIRFQLTIGSVIANLVNNNFFCQDILEIVKFIVCSHQHTFVHKKFIQKFDINRLLELIKRGIENQNYYLKKQSLKEHRDINCQEKYFKQYEQLYEGLTIQNYFSKNINISMKIWQTKIKSLEVLHPLTLQNYFSNIFFYTDFEQTLNMLLSLYLYSNERKKTTSQIQNSICVIFQNLIVLVQNLEPQQKKEEEENKQSNIITKNFQQTQLKNIQIVQIFKGFINQKINFVQLIQATNLQQNFKNIKNFINLLNTISEFMRNKSIDQEIIEKGALIHRIVQIVQSGRFNMTQNSTLITQLIKYISFLFSQQFPFNYQRCAEILSKQTFLNNICSKTEEQVFNILDHIKLDKKQNQNEDIQI